MTITVDDLRKMKAELEANNHAEPPPLVLLRSEAQFVFGEEAVRDVPDRVLTRICGREVFIAGGRWPMVPR